MRWQSGSAPFLCNASHRIRRSICPSFRVRHMLDRLTVDYPVKKPRSSFPFTFPWATARGWLIGPDTRLLSGSCP